MICFFDACRRPILPVEWEDHAEWHDVGGTEVVFGKDMPGGPLLAATGPLLHAAHHKCAFAHIRRLRLAPARAELLAARRADPFAQCGSSRDWRDQETHGVEVFAGESDRADRGPGAAGC
jgi:hypothetical protein